MHTPESDGQQGRKRCPSPSLSSGRTGGILKKRNVMLIKTDEAEFFDDIGTSMATSGALLADILSGMSTHVSL